MPKSNESQALSGSQSSSKVPVLPLAQVNPPMLPQVRDCLCLYFAIKLICSFLRIFYIVWSRSTSAHDATYECTWNAWHARVPHAVVALWLPIGLYGHATRLLTISIDDADIVANSVADANANASCTTLASISSSSTIIP